MTPRLLADENFNRAIVGGLLRVRPGVDVVRVQDVGLRGADDPTVLAWAGANDRIVLTHDYRTMPGHAADRIAAGRPMPGLFVICGMTIGQAVHELTIAVDCSTHPEWADKVQHLPM